MGVIHTRRSWTKVPSNTRLVSDEEVKRFHHRAHRGSQRKLTINKVDLIDALH